MQAVDAFIVDFILKALFQHLLFNADGLRVKAAVHKIGMEGRTQRDFGILGGQCLALQRKGILDAGHADAEVVVAAHRAGVHGQVCAVELCQLFGEAGHIRAVRIAALHHQRQQRMGSGRFTLGRKSKVDADAAAVEFSAGHRKMHTGAMRVRSNLFLRLLSQGSLFYDAFCKARNSSRLRPLARMARAFSTPTYRQCHGSNTTPVAACLSCG